jgi:hypothetical protein
MSTSSASPAVRAELVDAIKFGLVGPDNDHAFPMPLGGRPAG